VNDYDTSVNKIKRLLVSAAQNFCEIGYYLKLIRDNRLYESAGHASFLEMASLEFGFSKSTIYKHMQINDNYSDGGNSPFLAAQFKEFSKSKLQEMLYLPDELLSEVTPEMTVKEIRDLKPEPEEPACRVCGCTWLNACEGGCYWVEDNLCSRCADPEPNQSGFIIGNIGTGKGFPANPEPDANYKHLSGQKLPSDKDIKQFWDQNKGLHKVVRESLKEYLKENYRSSGAAGGGFSYKGSPRGITFNRLSTPCSEITWHELVQRINHLYPVAVDAENQKNPDNLNDEQLPGQMDIQEFLDDDINAGGSGNNEIIDIVISEEEASGISQYINASKLHEGQFSGSLPELTQDEIRGLQDYIEQHRPRFDAMSETWKEEDKRVYYKKRMALLACEFMLLFMQGN
jgi:hypothetical protein